MLPFEAPPHGFSPLRGLLALDSNVHTLLASASMERKNIGLRLSEEFLVQLDRVRGGVPREAWIRLVLQEAVRRALVESRS